MSDELIDWPRWPNLGIKWDKRLDWVVTFYDAETILKQAAAAEQGEWNLWTQRTAQTLRALAETPAAIKALNHHGRKHPAESLNRAVHYLLCLELRGEGQFKWVRNEIAAMWGCEDETVRRDVTDFGERARGIIEELLTTLQRVRHKTREELVAAFDRDMRHRAAHMMGKVRAIFPQRRHIHSRSFPPIYPQASYRKSADMITSIRLIPLSGPGGVYERRGGGRGGLHGGHSKFYAEVADGLWPPPIKFGRSSLQPEHEIDAMLAAIVAGASDDERRALVKQLVAQRKAPIMRADAPAAAAAS